MRRFGLGVGLALSIAGAMLACGGARLPAPEYVAQPTEALQPVSFPPPPARAEFVPDEPPGGAVWLDGEWTWQGKRWAWKVGRWVIPPAGAKFSPWATARDATGSVYVAEGKWRDSAGHEVADPNPIAVGRARAGPVITPKGGAMAAPTVPQSEVIPDGGDPSDAGLTDVDLSDVLDTPDAEPLRSPRMGAH